MRGLEAEPGAEPIDRAALAHIARPLSFEMISGIELEPRLGRPDLHGPARCRLVDTGRKVQRSGNVLFQGVVMIVAAAALQLLVVGFDALADRARFGEVHWRL